MWLSAPACGCDGVRPDMCNRCRYHETRHTGARLISGGCQQPLGVLKTCDPTRMVPIEWQQRWRPLISSRPRDTCGPGSSSRCQMPHSSRQSRASEQLAGPCRGRRGDVVHAAISTFSTVNRHRPNLTSLESTAGLGILKSCPRFLQMSTTR